MDENPVGPLSNPRLVAALVLLIAAWTALIVPLRVLGHGWLPPDDARRHAAKVVSNRSWDEVLVLRPEATIDPHPGWHALLELAERAGARTPQALAKVSVASLTVLFLLAPLPWLRRPEAWLLSLAAFAVFEPLLIGRMLIGRPLVFTMAVLLVVLAAWPRLRAERTPWAALALVAAAVAASAWIHGNWYLWALPIAAFLIAGERRAVARFAAAAAVGCAVGALATGRPLAFLDQTLRHPFWALGGDAPQASLVTEFRPASGSPLVLLLVGLLLLWRAQRGEWRIAEVATPAFMLAAVAWILAFRVQRFWLDWGLPAAMFWLALELQHVLERSRRAEGRRRLWIALGAAAVFVLAFTSDRGSRWSKYAAMRVAGIELESNRDWLPQPGGILYGDRIQYFYDLFFRFPTAPWRYQVGFEPALMPPADLAIFRAILVEGSSDDALRPWAERLRPADRLLIQRAGPVPKLPGLEWRSLAGDYWLGRTERGDGDGDRSGAAPAAEVEESPEL